MLQPYLDRLPLVAILRGVTPVEVVEIGQTLVLSGFAIVEIPLNSPDPIESIRALASSLGGDVLVGAGTVMTPEQVGQVAKAGGRLVVMPHSEPDVVRAAKAARLVCIPGIATPTEGFAALANGADALKLFPAEIIGPAVLKAMRSVFPKDVRMLPVGGITCASMAAYVESGASGFGLGSALYKPGDSAATVRDSAAAFVKEWRSISARRGISK